MSDSQRPLDQWVEEETTVSETELEVDVDHLGNPTSVRHKPVERTVKERVAYARLIPHKLCEPDKHYFEIRNGGRRENGRLVVQCRHCDLGKNFVVGVHKLVDGKVLGV